MISYAGPEADINKWSVERSNITKKPIHLSIQFIMTNPLLEQHTLPPFSQIKAEHVEPAISQLLEQNNAAIETLLDATDDYNWHNLVEPLTELNDRLNNAWSPVSHLNSVLNSEPLRDAYNACLPKLSRYWSELGHNRRLYEAYQSIADSSEFDSYDTAQKKVIDNALRDFKLSGIALPAEQKVRFQAIAESLSKLTSQYEEHILDATKSWTRQIKQADRLAGLPDSALAVARQAAEAKELDGWLLTLEFPCYIAVMTYADSRSLRRELYHAFATRASNQGPFAGQWDNSEPMEQILKLRHEKAQLLGFDNYAELSLATKMADTASEVIGFLEDLAHRSLPMARSDLQQLTDFAHQYDGITTLEAWDLGYYAEKLRQQRFDLSQEAIKQYFPTNRVIPGLFKVVERLYGITVQESNEEIDYWHPDVRLYEITDSSGERFARFYLDLYARPNKRGGAWMDVCTTRKKSDSGSQLPVAYLVCNFTPPVDDHPSLLTHDEVQTLFHEFGHGLHHMLTRIDYPDVSGINGVEWDAVELPSQMMENWCWEKEAIALISGHVKTGEPLPDTLFERLLAAKNFQSGMQMVRQLEFSLFDFRIHHEYDPKRGGRIYPILNEVRDQIAVFTPPSFSRFAHSFSHIFAGGYSAGYYSYKWAEVLSSDAFSLFEERGIFDQATGQAFRQKILEQGGSQDAMALFVDFRGREPRIDALLRHSGIVN